MGWDNKVVWNEGLFLQPQHLQQQDRYVERLVRMSTAGLRPFAWGLTQVEIDADLLTLGKFAVRSLAGILPDGTPFRGPGDVDLPRPLDLPEGARNSIIYLTLPARQPGTLETAPAEQTDAVARFVASEFEVADSNAGFGSTATVPVGRLRLRFAFEADARSGYVELGIARILDVRADRSVALDDGYIPPVLVCSASSVLTGFVNEVQGLITTAPRRWLAASPRPRPAGRPRSPTTCCSSSATATSPCCRTWPRPWDSSTRRRSTSAPQHSRAS